MADCSKCRYAIWDYEEFFGTSQKQWFVDGCKLGKTEEECEEEEQ